jgi:mannose-6-phosphate isomerase-like protein (cupin superfamily)
MRYAIAIAAAAALWAAAPAGFELWKGSDLRAMEKKLAPKVNAQKLASQPLGNFGNHSLVVIHRQGDGEAELHETQTDIFIVESGGGTLVVGGKVVNPKSTGPGEVRGTAIEGGEKRPLAPGDVAHIPAKMPHQVLVENGRRITYTIVKVTSQ